jgi:hypothetical protein
MNIVNYCRNNLYLSMQSHSLRTGTLSFRIFSTFEPSVRWAPLTLYFVLFKIPIDVKVLTVHIPKIEAEGLIMAFSFYPQEYVEQKNPNGETILLGHDVLQGELPVEQT